MRVTVSAVIPTRNRPHSLERLLSALAAQDRPPEEVIVVDGSDPPAAEALEARYPSLRIRHLRTAPALCRQRNTGIRAARGAFVLLLDDDIEPPADYLRRLLGYLEAHPAAGAASGLIHEPDGRGGFSPGLAPPSLRSLVFRFLFQLSVHGEVEATTGPWWSRPMLAALKRWYRARGNTFSLAGWPLFTQTRGPVVHLATYGLGAALIRRAWLLHSPYDEGLWASGIGDNYGVALGFPEPGGLAVLTDVAVRHHRAPEHRPDPAATYYQRSLALHYFMRRSPRFSRIHTGFLVWSLLGNALVFRLHGARALAGASLRAAAAILRGRNPLLREGTAGAASPNGSQPGSP
jgi:glycosyltransferase involved in cell wall biosynthesis